MFALFYSACISTPTCKLVRPGHWCHPWHCALRSPERKLHTRKGLDHLSRPDLLCSPSSTIFLGFFLGRPAAWDLNTATPLQWRLSNTIPVASSLYEWQPYTRPCPQNKSWQVGRGSGILYWNMFCSFLNILLQKVIRLDCFEYSRTGPSRPSDSKFRFVTCRWTHYLNWHLCVCVVRWWVISLTEFLLQKTENRVSAKICQNLWTFNRCLKWTLYFVAEHFKRPKVPKSMKIRTIWFKIHTECSPTTCNVHSSEIGWSVMMKTKHTLHIPAYEFCRAAVAYKSALCLVGESGSSRFIAPVSTSLSTDLGHSPHLGLPSCPCPSCWCLSQVGPLKNMLIGFIICTNGGIAELWSKTYRLYLKW